MHINLTRRDNALLESMVVLAMIAEYFLTLTTLFLFGLFKGDKRLILFVITPIIFLTSKEKPTLFLRKTSLDELPQLFNVLKGEMSFVGPRPLLIEYLKLYNSEQKKRHNVLPGITGWAQVNGRNAISWEEKFHYDVWYVEHRSFGLDMKILFLTFAKVFRQKDINATDTIPMEKFKGTP